MFMLHFFGSPCINLAQIYLLYIAVSLAELSNQSDFPPTKVLLFKLLSKLFHLSLKVFLTKENHEMHSKKLYKIRSGGIQTIYHIFIQIIIGRIFLSMQGGAFFCGAKVKNGRQGKKAPLVLKNFC